MIFRGITGKFFWGGKVIVPDFFPCVKCFFPVQNFHFGRPKTSFSGFEKQEAKKKTKTKQNKNKNKKRGSSPHFVTFPPSIFNFPPSLLQFSLFPSQFFTPLHFLLCFFFPSRSAEISRSEVSHSAPCPSPPPPVIPLVILDVNDTIFLCS